MDSEPSWEWQAMCAECEAVRHENSLGAKRELRIFCGCLAETLMEAEDTADD